MKNGVKIAYLFSALLVISPCVQALLVTGDNANSISGLGEFNAQFGWNGKELLLDLTNTSSQEVGGVLTGFLLNLPEGTTFHTTFTNTSLLPLLPHQQGYSGAPFGHFDYGYAMDGNYFGEGKAHAGIMPGQTGHFVFGDWETAADVGVETFFTLSNFIQPTPIPFVARFRGFEDGLSDKVPGILDDFHPLDLLRDHGGMNCCNPVTLLQVPVSSTLSLFMLGIGLLVTRFRQKFSS